MNSEFLPEAEEEFREAAMYYETKAPGVRINSNHSCYSRYSW